MKKYFAKSLIIALGFLTIISNSWLNMDLQVYNRNNSSTFMAYNFSSWIKNPVFNLEDAIGISVGEGMYIPGANDSSLRQAQYSYCDGYDPNNWNTRNLQTQIKNGGRGTIAKFKLDSYMGAYEIHNIMIQAPVNFHPHTNEGWISGHYLHKGKNISSISVDINVVPNLSISDASDRDESSLFVTR